MKIFFGQKIGMTQFWNDKGRLVGATVIKALPNKIIKIKDEFISVSQVAGTTKKPQLYLSRALSTKKGIWTKKVVLDNNLDSLTVNQFSPGDTVAISGSTKGKGFAGTIKRHNFHQGPRSHGSNNVRQPGSIGAQRPQRVVAGQKMPGQMGNKNLTVRGNRVIDVKPEEKLLIVSGAVPGARNGYVVVKTIENG